MVPSLSHIDSNSAPKDPRLSHIIALWDSLPEPIKVAIVAIIDTTQTETAMQSGANR